MNSRKTLRTLVLCLGLATAAAAGAFHAARAEDAAKVEKSGPDKEQAKDQEGVLGLLPGDAVTRHAVTAGGRRLGYSATAGTLTLRDPDGGTTAKMFYVAYTLLGQAGADRPVSFFFNGGPGAGSAFLNLGAAGPTVLQFPADDVVDGGAAELQDNPDTWLAFTDMVFIDAVGTGFSRPAKPADAPKKFWGVRQDGETFAKAIQLWLDKNGRARSPKYLVGESYGGLRALKVASALQHSQSVIPNGLILVSPLLDGAMFADADANPLMYGLTLPSFAAASLDRQHKLAPAALDEAYRFGTGEYQTIMAADPPRGAQADALYAKLAQLTGLPQAVVAKERGMLDISSHDVRSRDGRLYSLYDFTVSIADPYPAGDGDEVSDPLLEGYGRAYGNAFAGYAADALNFKTDLTYELLSEEVGKDWEWQTGDDDGAANGITDLRKLLALDPSLKVMIAHGFFDLVCPFSITQWLVRHIPVGGERVVLKDYPGGHMLYARADSRAALARDVAALYAAPSAR